MVSLRSNGTDGRGFHDVDCLINHTKNFIINEPSDLFDSYTKIVLFGIGGGLVVWFVLSIIFILALPRSWGVIAYYGITIIIPILTIFVIFKSCKAAKENFQEIREKERQE